MNETALTIEEAASHLSDVVDRVQASGAAAILLRAGRPVARIVPVPNGTHGSNDLIDFLRRWRTQYPEPDNQFAEAIEQSRSAVTPPKNPWE